MNEAKSAGKPNILSNADFSAMVENSSELVVRLDKLHNILYRKLEYLIGPAEHNPAIDCTRDSGLIQETIYNLNSAHQLISLLSDSIERL